MVLKRLLITALGALGLGALVAGTALAQSPQPPGNGNIPAPNLFDGQVACSTRVPTAMTRPMPSAVAMGAMASPLDVLLRGGDTSMGAGNTPVVIDTAGTGDGSYADLIYVIPADGSNCGSGDIFADDGSVSSDVARGYTAAFNQFNMVVAQETAVKNAQMALDTALKAVTPTNPNTPAITAAQKALDDANAELAKRNATLNSLAAGPIYQAGIAEWRAKMAVETAVTAWNTAVGDVDTKQTALDGSTYGTTNDGGDVVSGYVALTVDPSGTTAGSVGNVLDTDGTVNIGNLRNYVGTGGQTTDNFDDSGSLIVPMRETLDPDDGNAMEPTPTQASISDIRADVEAANKTVAALVEAQAKNQLSSLDDIYADGLLKARAEAAHLNAQWANAISDTATDFRTDEQKRAPTADSPNTNYVAAPITITSRYAEVQAAVAKRNTAEATLRSGVEAREMKTADLIGSFTGPRSFYEQLVNRRQALKDAASNVVNRITSAGGTPTTAQNNAVTDAQNALDAARKTQMEYEAIADNPANDALVDVLLETDGDDGLALVNAISTTYGEIEDNEDRLDALLMDDNGTETGRIPTIEGRLDDLEGDGDGGLAGEGRTDETIKGNADDIEMLDGRVAANEDDIGQIQTDLYGTTSGQHGDLAACDATGLLNVANCADARSRHNEADIEEVNDKLMQKKEYIDNLAAEIGVDPVTGEGTGEGGMSRIDMNAAAIDAEEMARMEADMALGGRIDAEATARMEADTMLGGRIDAEEMARMEADTALGMRIDTNAGDIMTNAGNIMSNEMAIGANAGNITSNANAIASNMNAIGQNRSAISDNRNMIGELSDDLEVVRAGVAASMALAGMPAINGRGIAIGVGSYDGESAFAVGFQIQGEQASFKVGVTSSGGETGASAGVGFNF